jgi:hypothetical protein
MLAVDLHRILLLEDNPQGVELTLHVLRKENLIRLLPNANHPLLQPRTPDDPALRFGKPQRLAL